MCGIFGLVLKENSGYPSLLLGKTLTSLFLLSESRGKEASGIAFYTDKKLEYYKNAMPAHRLVKTKEYKVFLENSLRHVACSGTKKIKAPLAVIGHTRLATNGPEQDTDNNQPIITEKIAGVHNGIVVNSDSLHSLFSLAERKGASDSEVLFSLLNLFINKEMSIEESTRKMYENIEGSASIAALISDNRTLLLATNTGSIYCCNNQSNSVCIFSSELPVLEKLVKALKLQDIVGRYTFSQVKAGTGINICIRSLRKDHFYLSPGFGKQEQKKQCTDNYFSDLLSGVKSVAIRENTPHLKRCSKCVLPSSIPYIKFNKQGVCNYCLNHKKIKCRGDIVLQETVSKYRRSDGRPDCLVGFSGGRDSAYALHYIKRVLKMNPIAFTFDWGMVADIARRNQARLVGKLGIEHIVISADIQRQRKFIRQNINAWLKRPHLGMVVLFMAGDKPAEYYVRKVAKNYGIDLVVLARGNEFENTDFKWGFLGMPRGEPRGVLHDLPIWGRAKFSLNSAFQFIMNPAYFNSAIWETLFDYWTTYILTYNFLYLWHYVPWDEAKIITTLKSEYNWETPEDTIQTWRIDDGTSPFYNYIYYTMAGFTENDAFRSNQIREGILNRKDALELVAAENMPRYKAIRDYLCKIGLDYDKVIQKIQLFPKLYNSV